MSHSFNKIWIHAIWATKYRENLIAPEIEDQIHSKIRAEFKQEGCVVRIINGMPDHIHCLFLLNRNRSIAQVLKQVKGSSSRFINENNLTRYSFSWQVGYAAYSVNPSTADVVYRYIKKQKEHHKKKTAKQEFNSFLEHHDLKPIE